MYFDLYLEPAENEKNFYQEILQQMVNVTHSCNMYMYEYIHKLH